MLILTRKIGESIRIGDEVFVTVMGVKGNQVRLGLDAPREITINREEVHQRMSREDAQKKQPCERKAWAQLH